MPKWQPIGTAPKDGTIFLAYAAAGQHGLPGLPGLFSLCQWDESAGFCICELREATHWMSLPEPPKE